MCVAEGVRGVNVATKNSSQDESGRFRIIDYPLHVRSHNPLKANPKNQCVVRNINKHLAGLVFILFVFFWFAIIEELVLCLRLGTFWERKHLSFRFVTPEFISGYKKVQS